MRQSSDGPTRLFRYDFSRAQRSWLRVDIRSAEVGGAEDAASVRLLQCELELLPKRTDRDLTYEFWLRKARFAPEPGVKPEMARKLDETARRVEGLFGATTVTDRGLQKEFYWSAPRKLPLASHQILVDLSRVLRQLHPPLPPGPVGKGSAWESESEVRGSTYRTTTTTKYTVTALDADGMTLSVKVDQTANAASGNARAERVHLEDSQGAGEGTTRLVLQPLAATTSLRLAMQSRYAVEREEIPLRARVDMSTMSETTATPFAP